MNEKPDVSRLRFFVEGKEATEDDVKDSPVTVVIGEPESESKVHVFKSKDSFHGWVVGTPHKRNFESIEKTVETVRGLEKEDHSRAIKVQRSRANWIKHELQELAKDTGLKPDSFELYQRAGLKASLLEGPLLNTAICHEHWDGTGGAVFLITAIPMPDFGWLWMNDKTSALTFWGAGVLTEDTWYRGRAFWFFGVHGWWPPMQLGFVGWNDIASAGYCIGP